MKAEHSETEPMHCGWRVRWRLRRTAQVERPEAGAALVTVAGLLRSAGAPPGRIALSGVGQFGLWRGLWHDGAYDCDILISPRVCHSEAMSWAERLRIAIVPERVGFALERASAVEPVLVDTSTPPDMGDELSLNFETPFSFGGAYPAGRVDAARLVRTIGQRIESWTGNPFRLPIETLQVNDALWHYDQVDARSCDHDLDSQPRVLGYRGRLVLRGEFARMWAALRVLEQAHLDDEPISIKGHFLLERPAAPAFQKQLSDGEAWARTADWVLSHTDAEPVVDEASGAPLDALALGSQLAMEVAHGRWQPRPSQAFCLPKPDGGLRTVERFSTRDQIVHRHLLGLLSRVFDHASSEAAHGARSGRGRQTALEALRTARREGFVHVLRADIENCFAQIDARRTLESLDAWIPRSDIALRQALERCVCGEVVPPAGGMAQPRVGLAQGSPLSPALASLALSMVDKVLEDSNVRLVRFADDMAVCCCSRENVERAKTILDATLASLGLRLNPDKTRILGPEEAVDFLGELVTVAAEDDLDSALAQRKPLLVAEPYALLQTHGEALDVRHHGELALTVPLRRVSEIVIVQRATLSTTLISRCAALGIPVTVALDSGRRTATFAPESRAWFRVARKQGIRYDSMSASARLAVATDIVDAKLNNQLTWLKRRPTPDEWPLIEFVSRQRVLAAASGSLDELRGHEGIVARELFHVLQARLLPGQREEFNAPARSRGSPDRLNSALNFGYHLLATRMYALLRAQGLDPHLGWLHDAQADYGTLVWDAIEPFRVHVDRTLVRLINGRRLTTAEYSDSPHGPRLTAEGKRVLFAGLEATWNSRVASWLLRDLMVAQAKALRDWALESGPLWWHRWSTGPQARPPARALAATGDPNEGSPA